MKIQEYKNPHDGGTYWFFHCPGCDSTHQVVDRIGRGGKGSGWSFNGDFEKPTFAPSILVHGSPTHPRCHSFVRDGKIEFLSDCTHALAGRTVDVPDSEPRRIS